MSYQDDADERLRQRILEQIRSDNARDFDGMVKSYLKLFRNEPTYSPAFQNFLAILNAKGLYDENKIDDLRYTIRVQQLVASDIREISLDAIPGISPASVPYQPESSPDPESAIARYIKENSDSVSLGLGREDCDDLPGRKDPLFTDALECCIKATKGSTSLLQRQLRIGYGRAASILDALVREGFLGDMDGNSRERPVLISSSHKVGMKQLDLQVFQEEASRLAASSEFDFVERFVKKFKRKRVPSEVSNLRNLLKMRGFEFRPEELGLILDFANIQTRFQEAKNRILDQKPFGAIETIKAYLNLYPPDDVELLQVLREILEEKKLFKLFDNSLEKLIDKVQKIQEELELEKFERRLLSDDNAIISLEDIDDFTGYEFEEFCLSCLPEWDMRLNKQNCQATRGPMLSSSSSQKKR
ncbi:MAG TPA: DNA translocase FtsK [Pyrinomonadaceae bacterium]|nr:hypothetical protein [Acidobacteriota bacterium]HQZ95406.1 DNA translocase FtsK [Pyrinomonadaceae bacterium]